MAWAHNLSDSFGAVGVAYGKGELSLCNVIPNGTRDIFVVTTVRTSSLK
jgi:hypothetical protein